MRRLPRMNRAAAALLAATLLLVACKEQTLYGDLTERQANEVVAALREAGLPAQKVREDKAYAVHVGADDFSAAVQLMRAQGLPRESFDSLGHVFKREGFVSTPLEERARLLYALSQELSNTVASIDGVVSARVHLVVPEKHPLDDKPQPAAASVFIKHRPDVDLQALTPKIRALVLNSVEGLPADKVTVALFPALPSQSPVAPAGVPPRGPREASGVPAWLPWSMAAAGALLVGAALGLRARRRPTAASQASALEPTLVVQPERPHG
ncbi:type III secretion inner membrane ring lipoprotein SctJ [Pelomonas sp. CA6]|uniref:type III secretion system inner membrane ring lipoprotein SctJ n=1 Tax=Pelomonas sp. CA6 TaxID=2907999 RepID=UPI001F4C4BE5|nr:type III secretion inner membrane ring lipoprotein SctJ [Pelomonas sp. CA6]MCH7345079.1 type III secretion inner membrane ring lipoprotein SctJ [Pelomonas sp. CA6]